MTFENAERSDWPPPPWNSKESVEEEFSKETYDFTDEHLRETKSLYDSTTDTIRNETRIGICSKCGFTLADRDAARCYYGDQLHARCAKFYNGRPVCRRHVESKIGGKTDAMVLAGISAGLDRAQFKKLSELPNQIIEGSKSRILDKEYVVFKGYGMSRKPTITPIGKESLYTMIGTYEEDQDFGQFLQKLGFIRNVETAKQA